MHEVEKAPAYGRHACRLTGRRTVIANSLPQGKPAAGNVARSMTSKITQVFSLALLKRQRFALPRWLEMRKMTHLEVGHMTQHWTRSVLLAWVS
jgi:hypothetical protein